MRAKDWKGFFLAADEWGFNIEEDTGEQQNGVIEREREK